MNREELLMPVEQLEIELEMNLPNLDPISKEVIKGYLKGIRHNMNELYNDYLDLKY